MEPKKTKKGFLKRLLDNMDQKLEEKSKKKRCSCECQCSKKQ